MATYSADYYKSKVKEGEDYDNLSVYDKSNSNSALMAYNQQKTLDDNLESQKKTAYYNQQKLMKYLPSTLKANGLSGNVGATNQAYLEANNNYQNTLNTLNSNYNSSSNDIMSNYLTNLDTNLSNQENASNTEYSSVSDYIDTNSENYKDDYGGYTTEGIQKLKDYVNSNSTLTQEAKNKLNSYIDDTYKTTSQDDIDLIKLKNNYGISSDDDGIDNAIAGVTSFGLNPDTTERFYVDEVVKMARNGKIKNGTLVKFGTLNYIYNNGKWFKTSRTNGASITNFGVGMLVSDGNTKTFIEYGTGKTKVIK